MKTTSLAVGFLLEKYPQHRNLLSFFVVSLYGVPIMLSPLFNVYVLYVCIFFAGVGLGGVQIIGADFNLLPPSYYNPF